MRYQLEAETGHRPKPEEKRRCDEERDERRQTEQEERALKENELAVSRGCTNKDKDQESRGLLTLRTKQNFDAQRFSSYYRSGPRWEAFN